MTPNPELSELGQLFRTRRNQLHPREVGIAGAALERRRVAGLRREEVAQLASISTDYYTRIEQGRLAPSEPVAAALVGALRLDAEQADYVRLLLDTSADASRSPLGRPRRGSTVVRPQLLRLMAQLEHTPALVFNRRLDIIAWNPLAAALYLDFEQLPVKQRNYVRLVFTHPMFRALYPEWSEVARTCVAVLRMNAAENPADAALSSMVGDLSIASAEFRQWWAERRVAHQDFGVKVLDHPVVGEMSLGWDSFHQTGSPDQQLVLWSAGKGTLSEQRLRELEGSGAVVGDGA